MILISTEDGSINVLRNIPSGWLMYQNALFSTDGKNIAFCSLGVGNPPHSDIFSMSLDSRDTVSIASHPAEDQLLQWAPDGKSLIFLSDRSGTWDIWSVRINGGKQQGEPELLKKDFDSDLWGGLGFSTGGSFYYKTHNNSGRIFKGEIDLETGKVLVPPFPVKTRYNGLPTQLTWSPDGNKLLYLSERGSIGIGKNTITIQSATTGEELLLSPRFCWVNQIFWVPDGNSVIARGMTVAGGGIYKINAETSEMTELPDVGMIPKLCPDGKTMVFGVIGPKIIKRNLDTSEETELVKAGNLHYDLSPDGKEIVFQVDDAVKKIPLIGGASQELFRDSLANYYGLEWTKDGRNIIVQTFGNSGCEIWRVPATGGTPIKLDLTYPDMGDFTINPDNRRFAFATDEGAKEKLWVLENFLPK